MHILYCVYVRYTYYLIDDKWHKKIIPISNSNSIGRKRFIKFVRNPNETGRKPFLIVFGRGNRNKFYPISNSERISTVLPTSEPGIRFFFKSVSRSPSLYVISPQHRPKITRKLPGPQSYTGSSFGSTTKSLLNVRTAISTYRGTYKADRPRGISLIFIRRQ